jgi:hypothetical protein
LGALVFFPHRFDFLSAMLQPWIGPLELSKVSFLTLAGVQKDPRTSDFDGLLSTGLFKRILICHTDHFAVLDPR